MKIVCKLTIKLSRIEGQSENGNYWCRQQFVCETIDGDAKKIAFMAFGERRVKQLGEHQVGELIEVTFLPDCRPNREGDKWFTDLMCTGIVAYAPAPPTCASRASQA